MNKFGKIQVIRQVFTRTKVMEIKDEIIDGIYDLLEPKVTEDYKTTLEAQKAAIESKLDQVNGIEPISEIISEIKEAI